MRVLLVPYVHGLGHLMPCLAIGEALKARGHEAIVACGTLGKEYVLSRSLRYEAIRELEPFAVTASGEVIKPAPRADGRIRLADPEYLTRCIEDETRLIADLQPDVVLFDQRHTAGISAARWNTPSVGMIRPSGFLFPIGEILEQTLAALHDMGEQHAERLMGDVLALPDLSIFAGLSSVPHQHRRFLSMSRELRYVGPILSMRPSCLPSSVELRRSWAPPDRALVLMSHGGTALSLGRIRASLAALEGTDAAVVVVPGPNLPDGVLDAAANRFRAASPAGTLRFVTGKVDMLPLLKAADVAIIHGGHASVNEALACATPSVVIPTHVEQEANGARLVSMGVGVVLREEEIHTRLGVVLRGLLGEEVQRQAGRVAAGLEAFDGAARMVDLLEDLRVQHSLCG